MSDHDGMSKGDWRIRWISRASGQFAITYRWKDEIMVVGHDHLLEASQLIDLLQAYVLVQRQSASPGEDHEGR